jgi:hypothetical protein
MCYSPQADLVGGVAISAIGVDAVRHVHRLHGHLAIASLPLILGAHQLDEAVVWFWQQGHISRSIGELALWIYLLIAFVVLPLFVPLAIVTLEPTKRRRWSMAPFVAIGTGVAVVLLAAMVHGPVGVSARPYHLAYSLHIGGGFYIVGLYVVAVCGALLLSGYRHVAIFGLVNLVAVAVIAKLTVDGFASVWCGWAAVTSGAIALHMRFARPRRTEPGVVT